MECYYEFNTSLTVVVYIVVELYQRQNKDISKFSARQTTAASWRSEFDLNGEYY
jgi:hypothetical protein